MKKLFVLFFILYPFIWNYSQEVDVLNEDFDDVILGIPDGWDNSDNTLSNGSYNWQYYVPGYRGEGKCLRFNSYSTILGEWSRLKSPVFSLEREQVLRFKFKNADAGDFSVYLSIDGGKTCTNLIEGNLRSNEWVEREYSLASYVGVTNACLVFMATSNSGSGDAFVYLDDVVVEDIPLCSYPKDLSLFSSSQNSAMIMWNLSGIGGEPEKYRLVLENYLAEDLDTIEFVSEELFYEILNLSDNTEYGVVLEAYCGVGKGWSDKSEELVFRTLCNKEGLPFVVDFDDVVDGDMPECWVYSGDVKVQLVERLGDSGGALELLSTVENGAMVVTPQLLHRADDLDIRMKVYGEKGMKFKVGLMSDPTLAETFEVLWVDSIKATGVWLDYRRPTLTSVAYNVGDSVSIAISLDAGVVGGLYVDSMLIDVAPSCMYLYDIKFETSDASSITISWSEYVDVESYEYEYEADGLEVISGSVLSNPCQIGGLEPSKDYRVRVRAVCGEDKGEWSNWVDCKTMCEPRKDAVFLESFEKGGIPTCWVSKQTVGSEETGKLNYGDKGWYTTSTSSNLYSGSAALWGRKSYKGIHTIVASQSINIERAGMYDMKFWMKRLDLNGSDVLQVWVNNRPDTVGGVKLDVLYNDIDCEPIVSSSGWYQYEYNIPLSGVVYIVFEAISNNVNAFYIDELEVFLAPTCRRVENVRWVDATISGGIIEWDRAAEEEAWIVTGGLKGSDLVLVRDTVYEPRYEFSGLESATDYTVVGEVMAYCGGEDKGDSVSFEFSFMTDCESVVDYPFIEDFEGEMFPPKCWTQWQVASPDILDSTHAGWGRNVNLSNYVYKGVASAQLYNWDDGYRHVLVTPMMNLGEGGYRLSFWQYRHYGYTIKQNEGIRVLINEEPSLEGATELIYIKSNMMMYPEVNEAGFYKYKVDIPVGGNQYLIFEGVSEGYTSSFIDNVEISKIPNCDEIGDFEIIDVLHDRAWVKLNEDLGDVSWQVSCGEGDFEITTGKIVRGEDSIIVVNGLDSDKDYKLYARRVCGDEYGEWSEISVGFRTLCSPIVVRAESEWFEGFEEYELGSDIKGCYIQEYDSRTSSMLEAVGSYSEMNMFDDVSYVIEPKTGGKFALATEYNSDNWLFGYVDLLSGENYELSVMARHGDVATNIPTKVSLAYGSRPMADSMTTYLVKDYIVDGEWTQVLNSFRVEESGNYFIGIHLQINDYYEKGGLDDIRLRVSNCVVPVSMSASRVTNESVILNVVSLSDSVRIVLSDRYFNPVSEVANVCDTIVESSTSRYVFNKLQPNTKYYYSVCGVCGEYESDWLRVDSFETRCLSVDLPLRIGFEGDEIDCWSQVGEGDAEISTMNSYEGNSSWRLDGVTVITPELNIGEGGLWDYMLNGRVYSMRDGASFAIGVMLDPNEVESFEMLSSFTVHKRSTWTEFFSYFGLLATDDNFAEWRDSRYVAIVVPSDVEFYFDNIVIEKAEGCFNPTEVVLGNVTTTTCDLSWVVNGKETQWGIRGYSSDGNLAIDTIVKSNNVTIGGLRPSNYYDFYVRALCSDIEESKEVYAGGIRTLCMDVMPLPYFEGMEGTIYLSDLCFSYVNNKADYPSVALDKYKFVMGGSQSLELVMSSSEALCVVLPKFELPTNKLRISFDYRNETADERWNTDLVLGVITDKNDLSTFDTLKVCDMKSDSTRVYYYFDSIPETLVGGQIAFKYGPGPINNRSCGIDNILVEEIPSCIEPAKEIDIVEITDKSIKLKIDGRGANKWEYVVVNNGEDIFGQEIENVVESSIVQSEEFEIKNLTDRTYYDVYIRSVCDDGNSMWVGPLSFRTNCKDGMETPWIETFEDYSDISEGCFFTIVNGDGAYTNNKLSGGKYASRGEKGMLLSLAQYDELYVVLPRFNADLSDLKIVFDYYSEEHDGVTGDLILGVMSDLSDILTFKQLYAYGTTSDYVTVHASMEGVGSEYDSGWIVFKWCNFREEWSAGPTYYAYCGLDNIKVESQASCFEPEDFSLFDITDTSAVVVWNHIEEIENSEWRLSNGSTGVISGENKIELEGLNAGDDYVLEVRTLCSDTSYSDWVEYKFNTISVSPSLPYKVDFEDEEENLNWVIVNGEEKNRLVVGSDVSAVCGGNKSLYVTHDDSTYFYYFNYASDVHAYRPIYLEAGEYLCEFSWKCSGEDTRDYGRLYLVPVSMVIEPGVNIASQAYVPEGCVAIDGGIHLNGTKEWIRSVEEFSIAEDKFYNIVVSWHNSESDGSLPPFAIDDIVIKAATCLPVDSLRVKAKTDERVDIAFKGMSAKYHAQLIGGDSELDFNFEGDSLILTDLLSETIYELRLRGICGEGDTSQWRSIEFKTEKESVDAPYSTGFEMLEDNSKWTILNGGNNAFIVGSDENAVMSGDSALYVHNILDSYAISYNYVKYAGYSYDPQYIYAYRLINFEPGAYYIDYDWKSEGKESEDYGRVFLVGPDVNIEPNKAIDSELIVPMDEGGLYGVTDWDRRGGVLQVFEESVYKLVVMWRNEVDGTFYSGPKPLSIDNIVVEKLDCNVVDSIRLTNLGDTYAEVEYVNLNTEGKVLYDLISVELDSIVESGTAGDNRLVLGNLESNKMYVLSLKVQCDDGGESPSRTISFKTTKYQYNLPYETGFEIVEDNDRWSFVQSSGSNKFVINSDIMAVNRGFKALYVSSGDSVYGYVDYERNVMAYVSLSFDEPGAYVVNYDWKVKGEINNDYARVFLAPTSSALVVDTRYLYDELRTDFIAVDGGSGLCFDTAIWHNHTSIISITEPMNYNFVVTWHNDRYINGTPPIAIDNIIIKKNSCEMVKNIEVYDVQDVTAKVRFESDASMFEYRVSLTYDVEDAFVSGVASANGFELSGLKPNALQYLFVRAKCSDTDYSLWQKVDIQTYCDDIITITKTQSYKDDFEYTELDPCWIVSRDARSTGAISMFASLETTVFKATNDVDVRLTRPFNLIAGKRYELSFKSRQRELLEDSRVGFVAGFRGEDYDTLAQYQVTQTYEVYDATFTPTKTGVYELGFRVLTPWWCNNPTSYLLTVDDFEVKEVLLMKPEDFVVEYLSSTEVDLTWVGDGLADSYEVELLIDGKVVSDTIVEECKVGFDNLKNSTYYEARVRGLLTLAGDSSSWSTLSFRTHCDVVRLPFREDFENNGNFIPECWTLASELTEDLRDWSVKEESNGNKMAYLSTSLAHGYAVLRTPMIFVDSDIYSLSFRYSTTISTDEYFVVLISDDAGYTFADTIHFATKVNGWSEVEYALSDYVGKTIMIEFKVRSLKDNSYSEGVQLDDVDIVCRSKNEVVYTDHICWGNRYRGNGFDVDTEKLKFGLNRIEELVESHKEGECDTLKVLNLNVDPAGTFYLADTICPGDVYNEGAFAGYNLTETGTYLSEPQISSCGCDSIVRLYLVVQPQREIINDTICEGEIYEFADMQITETGIYVDTVSYCEFRVLNLIVHPKYFEQGDTICEGTFIEWEDMILRESGRYEKLYQNVYGCDSVEVMNLWVIPERVEFETTICQGTTYYFGGKEIGEAGVYVDSLVNILGCDSIVTLSLSVSQPNRSHFEDFVCEGYEYVGYGFRLSSISQDTLLQRTTSTIEGCDSIIEVFVEFVPTVVVDTTVSIVEGEYYEFGENTLTKPGVYREVFATTGTSCDSIVNLTLEYATFVDGVYVQSLVISPNPVLGGANVYIYRDWSVEEKDGLRVEFVDAMGQVLEIDYPIDYPISIATIGVRGVYFVRIISGTGEVYIGKIVVN